jgi:large conductance mechanosensitive channel
MKILKEFKEFALKGNMIDLAVAVIIGGAFGKVITSLVNDVLMPPLGMLMGGVDFSDKVATLKPEQVDAAGKVVKAAVMVRYGLFINTLIDFTLVALAIFLVIKLMNTAKQRVVPPPKSSEPTVKECPLCLSTIPLKAIRCSHCAADLPH